MVLNPYDVKIFTGELAGISAIHDPRDFLSTNTQILHQDTVLHMNQHGLFAVTHAIILVLICDDQLSQYLSTGVFFSGLQV